MWIVQEMLSEGILVISVTAFGVFLFVLALLRSMTIVGSSDRVSRARQNVLGFLLLFAIVATHLFLGFLLASGSFFSGDGVISHAVGSALFNAIVALISLIFLILLVKALSLAGEGISEVRIAFRSRRDRDRDV